MCKYIAWFIGSFITGSVALAIVYSDTSNITAAGTACAVILCAGVASMIVSMILEEFRPKREAPQPQPQPLFTRDDVLRAIRNGNQRNTRQD